MKRFVHLLLILLGIAAVVAVLLWQRATGPVTLTVRNLSEAPVTDLQLYGDGLRQPVQVDSLLPGAHMSLELHPSAGGELRIAAYRADAYIESRLLLDVAVLEHKPMELEIGPGNRYILREQ